MIGILKARVFSARSFGPGGELSKNLLWIIDVDYLTRLSPGLLVSSVIERYKNAMAMENVRDEKIRN